MSSMAGIHCLGRRYRKVSVFFICFVAVYFAVQAYMSLCREVKTAPVPGTMKPHVVFGILSADKSRTLRDAQRQTWISSAVHTELPFRLTYKFLLDYPTKENIQENQIYNDIVYLNATHHGRAVQFGEKLHNWIKYISKNYPDALLGAKIDDDAFLCVPQIFQRLDTLKSSKLYIGWGHGYGGTISKDRRIDEMFVVLGIDLIHRIADRKYCEDTDKCAANDLVDTNYGGTSLGIWLSIYTDVAFYTDNNQLLHIRPAPSAQNLGFKYQNLCEKWLLFHKSTPDLMNQLHIDNKKAISCYVGSQQRVRITGGVTGSLFSGEVIRDTPLANHYLSELQPIEKDDTIDCNKLAVVTTIHDMSEAVLQMSKESEWCMVIVADTKTPNQSEYLRGISSNRVKYLSIETQKRVFPLLSNNIPLNHFGRKNIGYMYAIQHKATVIWDFDDDNIGVIKLKDLNEISKFVTVCSKFASTVVNPYPYFGPENYRVWPRGFPLQHIKDNKTIPKICELKSRPNLGVIQSLANAQPDVDAIYRLTHDMPFNFTSRPESHPHLVLPKDLFAPFNAQATLWMSPAFAYLVLPISVSGRVSDIWRSYIALHFMHKEGCQLAFSAPYVYQRRNEHMDMKDFDAELDLYEKSEQMIKYLSSEQSAKVKNLVEMYKHLYERGYLEIEDVYFIEAWTQTLESVQKKLR